jgi:hypothetical protein
VSETTFDGTLISRMSFETLAFDDLSATRLTSTCAVKPAFTRITLGAFNPYFLVSRTTGEFASVNSTTSSPVTVLMS